MLNESFSQGEDQRQWQELLALDPAYAHWSEHEYARDVPCDVPCDADPFDPPDSPDGVRRDIKFNVNPSLTAITSPNNRSLDHG